MPTDVEARWLDYAWDVVDCPDSHRRACEAAGGGIPGPGRVDGNDLRWPGYLGRDYCEGSGVLCVGAVHREAPLAMEATDPIIARTNRELVAGARTWLRAGRSPQSDAAYLERLRSAYEEALPRWPRWRRHFRTLVEDYLSMSSTQIAWTNLAKCRVSIDRGAAERASQATLTRLCQRQFPARELVEAIRPAAVLVAVLGARPGGDLVETWHSPRAAPLVFAWQGQSGHDRMNTDPAARRLSEWGPEAAERIKWAMRAGRSP